jgi:alanyl-tRNA synthetase
MPMFLSTDEIRKRWIEFFVARGHKHIASDSLVPQNDPSVLFTGAGMNQFKDHFMGRAKLDHPQQRAVTVQKCIRTGDIENVGRTPSHHTLFEMLGNFSFGDYFKKEAIEWAWTFTTDPVKGLGMEKDRLSVTVYGGNAALGIAADEEAEKYWKQFAPELQNNDGSWRIYRYGDKDNFWPANAPSDGPNGPCGPCSEMYFDTKPEQGAPEPVADSKDPFRYIEIGNKVFTQFNRLGVGKLEPLGRQNIDVGDGLERLARVIQGKVSNFEIDLLLPIVEEVARIAGKKYESASDDGRRMRRITDHTRAAVFCIADGVTPKNEGRNYVVRRLMRRAILDGRELGISEPFLGKVAKVVIKQMSVGYPELLPRTETIVRFVDEEEAAFSRTLVQGRQVFEEVVGSVKSKGEKEISGADAFKLWDTFGFPFELTLELAQTLNLTVDKKGFEKELEEAAKRSQAGSAMSKEIFAGGPVADLKKKYAGQPTEFKGYDVLHVDGAKILAIVQGDKLVDVAHSGDAVVLLDKTSFYAESGGQVGDKGRLVAAGRTHAVLDTQKQEGLFFHRVKIDSALKVGDTATAEVDPSHRAPTIKNHSATHLLHHALRKTLGTHVEQRGSLVAPDRLRFDFTHFEQIKPEQLQKIEDDVNALVTDDLGVSTEVLPIAEAKAKGAMALFGEKYGEKVRVVSMGPSIELCGGTHCKSTGQIGYFRIVSENSVAAGVRRIEAFTGLGAVADARRNDALLNTLALQLKTKKETVIERFTALQQEKAALEHELESLRKKAANAAAGELLSGVKDVGGTKLLAAKVEGADAAGLRTTLDGIRKNLKEGAVVLGGAKDGKVALLVSLSPDVVARGGHAGNLLKELAPKVGGKGGGKPDMAQGGGTDAAKLPEALAGVEALLKSMLK